MTSAAVGQVRSNLIVGESLRADARANRKAILRAARALLAEHGIDVPFRTIAVQAQVGIATLYRHFPDQEALLLGVARDVLDEVLALIAECEEAWDDDPESAWQDYARQLGHLRLGVILPELGHRLRVEHLPAEFMVAREEGFRRLDQLIERAWKAGLLRERIPAVQFNAGLAIVTRALPEQSRAFVPDLTDWLIDVYLRGLR